MTVFFYFFLSHMLGDYVFQTSFIARNKNKNIYVLILHILIIYACMYIVILPKGLTNNCLLILLSVMHFFIDIVKFKFGKNDFFKGADYYLFDQFIHLLTLLIVSYFFVGQEMYLSYDLVLKSSVGLFNAFTIGILSGYIFNDMTKYKKDYFGYLIRFSIPFLPNLWFLLLSVPVYVYFILRFMDTQKSKQNHEKLFSLSLSYIITIIILEVA